MTGGFGPPAPSRAATVRERDSGDLGRRLREKHWWWWARRRYVLSALRRLRPGEGWGRILHVGCGDGHFFDELSGLGTVEGVELDGRLVSPDGPHRDRIHVEPFDGSFQPGHRYGLILMLDVLERVPDPVSHLRYALRLLEPGGRVLVTVPAFPILWSNLDVVGGHFVRYTRRTFRPVAEAAGLRLDEMRYFFHWTWPAKLALKIVEEFVRPGLRPPRLPPAWLNTAFFALARAEQRLLAPLRPPFGSSLMAVGGREDG